MIYPLGKRRLMIWQTRDSQLALKCRWRPNRRMSNGHPKDGFVLTGTMVTRIVPFFFPHTWILCCVYNQTNIIDTRKEILTIFLVIPFQKTAYLKHNLQQIFLIYFLHVKKKKKKCEKCILITSVEYIIFFQATHLPGIDNRLSLAYSMQYIFYYFLKKLMVRFQRINIQVNALKTCWLRY